MLPTDHGTFRAFAYRTGGGVEHLALVAGDLDAATGPVLVRVHSECLTGDVLASRRCDCGAQLATALQRIDAESRRGSAGVVVYLRGHEGRGIGLANKIRAYQLQEDGLDTVDANTAQGFPADGRSYGAAAAILADLGVTDIRLLTNNPAKATGLEAAEIAVTAIEPLVVDVGPEADGYLAVKRDRLGHRLPTNS
jgi:GTP cyclohydrolase II